MVIRPVYISADDFCIIAKYQNVKRNFDSEKGSRSLMWKRFLRQSKIELANQTLHQTPDTWAVPAGARGGAGELVVRVRHDVE